MDGKYKKQRSDKYKEQSKIRLSDNIKKKIQTTMIGAISSIEDHFGEFLDSDESLSAIFQNVRADILDKGNHQLRNVDVELSQYEVEWNRYTYAMPVKTLKEKNNE